MSEEPGLYHVPGAGRALEADGDYEPGDSDDEREHRRKSPRRIEFVDPRIFHGSGNADPPILADSYLDVRKRSAILRDLRGAGMLSPLEGEWCGRTWGAFNKRFFDGKLGPIIIQWGLSGYKSPLGFFQRKNKEKRIVLNVNLIRKPSLTRWGLGYELGVREAHVTLLHEMMHQAVSELYETQGKNDSHNTPAWVAEINRILDLPEFRGKTEKRLRARVLEEIHTEGKKTKFEKAEGFLSIESMASFPSQELIFPTLDFQKLADEDGLVFQCLCEKRREKYPSKKSLIRNRQNPR